MDISYLLRDCADNDTKNSWLELSQAYFNKQDYISAYWAAKQSEKTKKTDEPLWEHWVHDLIGNSTFQLKLYDESLKHMVKAWEKAKWDTRMAQNAAFIRKFKNKNRYKILWPTIRPKIMKEQYRLWLQIDNPTRIDITIAVNTQEQADQLIEFDDIIICGDELKGVTHAATKLSQNIKALPGDIIILASDDFYPPKDWDKLLKPHFDNFHGCIRVNDTGDRERVITIPIMDYYCLTRLNNIIYHPSYIHLYSDNELYDNVESLGLLKDKCEDNELIFKHKHWYDGQREHDDNDIFFLACQDKDRKNYIERVNCTLQEKLKV